MHNIYTQIMYTGSKADIDDFQYHNFINASPTVETWLKIGLLTSSFIVDCAVISVAVAALLIQAG